MGEEEEKLEAEEGEGEVEVGVEGEGDEMTIRGDDEDEAPRRGAKKLTNQFNFCERAALTYNLPTRVMKS